MNGSITAQILIQAETDTYEQVLDNPLVAVDLANSPALSNTQITLAVNNNLGTNTTSAYTISNVTTLLYLRATDQFKLALTGGAISGNMTVDRLFFIIAPFSTVVLTNLSTEITVTVEAIWG